MLEIYRNYITDAPPEYHTSEGVFRGVFLDFSHFSKLVNLYRLFI